MRQRPTIAPNCSLTGTIEQRTLRNEDAGATLRDVAAGTISPWLLAWLPLRQRGAEPGIIEGWSRQALKAPGKDLGILAGLTLTFARLAGNQAVWEFCLEGIDVVTSPYLEELREKVRALAREEGRAEALREAVLSLAAYASARRQAANRRPS